jgi:hypothetical protein
LRGPIREVKNKKDKRGSDMSSQAEQGMTGIQLRKGGREGREKEGEREKKRVTDNDREKSRADGGGE